MSEIVIAVICHQGIGSSLWLKLLVQKIITQYQIPATIIQSDLNSIASEEVHIVIGMNYLKHELEKYGKTQITIHNILDNELKQKLLDNEIIKTYLQERM